MRPSGAPLAARHAPPYETPTPATAAFLPPDLDAARPMTTPFRKKLRNAVMLGILGLGLIAIVITGFGTDGMGGLGGVAGGQSNQTLVEVADEELTDAEVSRQLDNAYRRLLQQQPTLDRAQFYETSFNSVLDQMVDSEALVAFARSQGFVVPKNMVDEVILSIPGMRNTLGQFDRASFDQLLQQERLSEQQLRARLESDELLRLILSPVATASHVPAGMISEYANLQLETRTGTLAAVPTAALAAGMQPSDQEVAAFYQQNQRLFQLPERRVLRFATIGREQLGEAVRATDQEVAAYYQENQAQYGPGETRSIQLFTAPDESAARRLAEQVRSGTNFLAAAQAAGFSPEDVNFPNQTRQQLTGRSSQEVADAAFGAQQGAIVGPFRTQIGFQVVRIDGVTRTPGRPLDSVRGEIVAAVEQRKAADLFNERIDQIEEQVREGASFEEVVQAQRLTVQTSPAMTATGAAPNFQFPAQLAPLLQATFDFSPNDDPVVEIVQPDQQAALIQVANVLPPAAPPLEQIRDQVRSRLIQQTAGQRAKAVADQIVARINGGMPATQAFAQAGVRIETQAVTRRRFEISRPDQQVSPPLTVLFAIPQGKARVIPVPDGSGWVVVYHQQRTAGNAARDPIGTQLATALQQQLAETGDLELEQQFARAVRANLSVERNEEAIEALRQRLRSGQ
jgi:peptidyl-prolyl cis-trans isomerase D